MTSEHLGQLTLPGFLHPVPEEWNPWPINMQALSTLSGVIMLSLGTCQGLGKPPKAFYWAIYWSAEALLSSAPHLSDLIGSERLEHGVYWKAIMVGRLHTPSSKARMELATFTS